MKYVVSEILEPRRSDILREQELRTINRIRLSKKAIAAGLTGFFLLGILIGAPVKAEADSYSYAKVSFTFDDAYLSALTEAAPVLAKYEYSATNYVPTSCVGSSGTCLADEGGTYMSWAQVHALRNTYGWEIGAHTNTHVPMTTLTATQKLQQITQSQQIFTSQGLAPTAFASPEGDYDPATLALLSKYYSSHRGFHDTGYNSFPYNDYILRVQQVQVGVSVAQVKSYIDYAKANGAWLILVFHDIQDIPNQDPEEYEYATSDLDQIAAYVKQQNLPVTNVTNGLITSTVNMLSNGTFSAGLSGGWTTDAPANVQINTANNGRIPNALNSVRLVGNTAKNIHLFAPKIFVNASDTYVIKNYIKITQRTSGDVTYYIDEYDDLGNWISGQYKASVSWLFPEEKTFAYKPTSSNVKSARLQVIVPAKASLTAFVDNFEWFSTTGTPVTPPAVPSNLVANANFDSGISGGWTTDKPASISADSTNKGSGATPLTSAKLTSAATNAHLFSPSVDVIYGAQYQLSCYLNIFALSPGGYIGFYIDEYDASGNWISGQYKTERNTIGAANTNFSYTPSSASVKRASLQVIAGAGAGTVAYIDNIGWYKL